MEAWKRLQKAYEAMKTPSRFSIYDTANTLKFDGLVRAYSLPFETEEEYRRWWLPEVALVGGRQVVTRPARMNAKEKSKYLAAEAHNILTQGGRTQILGFIGSPVFITSQTPFAQYFAVGTSHILVVSSGDIVVNGELARAVPSSAVASGTQIDVSTFFGTATANGSWTNCGLFGNNATATPVSGTLMTHSLFTFTKVNTAAVTVDYLINQT